MSYLIITDLNNPHRKNLLYTWTTATTALIMTNDFKSVASTVHQDQEGKSTVDVLLQGSFRDQGMPAGIAELNLLHKT